MNVSTISESPTPSHAWKNINWSTTYSSDEDSQSSASSRCLFADHGEEDDLVIHERMVTVGPTPPVATRMMEEDPLLVMVDQEQLVEPALVAVLPFSPPQTRRRTRSRILEAAELQSEGVESTRSSSSLNNNKSRRISLMHLMWLVLALTSTVIMMGGVQSLLQRSSTAHSSLRSGNDSSSATLMKPSHPVLSLSYSMQSAHLVHHPSNVRSVTPGMIHAIGVKTKPLTFRNRSPPSPRKMNVITVVLHGMYVSLLLAVVLWSFREVQREMRGRIFIAREEDVCAIL